jgi:hypothetical protein
MAEIIENLGDIQFNEINFYGKNFTPFKDLPVSTATIMVYSNIIIDPNKLFCLIPITIINPPLTKKKKNIDKKNLVAPYGAIIGMQLWIYFRGIRTSKRKKYWCPVCQLYNEENEKKFTIIEEDYPISEEDKKFGYPDDTRKIFFKCIECCRYIKADKLGKIVAFLNQLTITISIGDIMINVMMFKDKYKLSGNKSLNNAIETTMILWENYILPLSKEHNINLKDSDRDISLELYDILTQVARSARHSRSDVCSASVDQREKNDPLSEGNILKTELLEVQIPNIWEFQKNSIFFTENKEVHFLFELVMENVGFNIGFPINKPKLNYLMNRVEINEFINNEFVDISQLELTSATQVNIKMCSKIPDNFMYDILVYEINKNDFTIIDPYIIKTKEKIYGKKKLTEKQKNITFIVFSSAEVILSGRYESNMSEMYEFFIKTVNKHKNEICEKFYAPTENILDFLKNFTEKSKIEQIISDDSRHNKFFSLT